MSSLTTPPVAAPTALVAADVRKSDHPLHKAYTAFRGANPDSLRQARKFLAATPWTRAKPVQA
jgi:hypothetical protein